MGLIFSDVARLKDNIDLNQKLHHRCFGQGQTDGERLWNVSFMDCDPYIELQGKITLCEHVFLGADARCIKIVVVSLVVGSVPQATEAFSSGADYHAVYP